VLGLMGIAMLAETRNEERTMSLENNMVSDPID
jgi:hypothetical protein